MIARFNPAPLKNPFENAKKTPPSYHNGRVAKVKARRAKNKAAKRARKARRGRKG